jgi:hypothetical protein
VIRSLHNAFATARFRCRELMDITLKARVRVEGCFLSLDTAFPVALAPSEQTHRTCGLERTARLLTPRFPSSSGRFTHTRVRASPRLLQNQFQPKSPSTGSERYRLFTVEKPRFGTRSCRFLASKVDLALLHSPDSTVPFACTLTRMQLALSTR